MGGGGGIRDARGRLLAGRRRRAAPLRGRHPHRRRRLRRRPGARRARPARPRDLRARLLPEQPASGRRPSRRGQRPSPQGDRCGGCAGRSDRRHLRRQRQGSPARREPRALPRDLARPRLACDLAGRPGRDRELPDDLQPGRVAGREQPRVVAGDLGGDVPGDPRSGLRAQPPSLASRLADDRRRARDPRLRRAHPPHPREGSPDRPRRALSPRDARRPGSAGRRRDCRGSAR